uniref:Uncharacterized protein n=1 Tax=Anguilla anguilla TaxID=7936 RepID=A0A0E9S7N1_ANGAN
MTFFLYTSHFLSFAVCYLGGVFRIQSSCFLVKRCVMFHQCRVDRAGLEIMTPFDPLLPGLR